MDGLPYGADVCAVVGGKPPAPDQRIDFALADFDGDAAEPLAPTLAGPPHAFCGGCPLGRRGGGLTWAFQRLRRLRAERSFHRPTARAAWRPASSPLDCKRRSPRSKCVARKRGSDDTTPTFLRESSLGPSPRQRFRRLGLRISPFGFSDINSSGTNAILTPHPA
jgi:hypothetical protein